MASHQAPSTVAASSKLKKRKSVCISNDGLPQKTKKEGDLADGSEDVELLSTELDLEYAVPEVIVGTGSLPHIVDITSIPTPTSVDYAQPRVYVIEREREYEVVDRIIEVYDVLFKSESYDVLGGKVEIQKQRGDTKEEWYWYVDSHFIEKSVEAKTSTIKKWLVKLSIEATALHARPHHWIIRTKAGDVRMDDPTRQADSGLLEYSMMAKLAGHGQVDEHIGIHVSGMGDFEVFGDADD